MGYRPPMNAPLPPALFRCAFRFMLMLPIVSACASQQTPADDQKQGRALKERTAVSDRQAMAATLRQLKPVDNEGFRAFLARAQAALLAADQPELAAKVRTLPRDSALWVTPKAKAVLPTLVSLYARSQTDSQTLQTLRTLVQHPTVNPGDSKTPGEGPAFDAMQADVAAFAAAHGLSFDSATKGVWLVGMPSTDPGVPNLNASIGVLTHADVVPATEAAWRHDPFGAVMEGDRLVARGALDDKGAIAAVLTSLATLNATGTPLIRFPVLLVGTSEETHWAGIERFVDERQLPRTLLVADGSFPMGIGEKGITTVTLEASNVIAAPEAATGAAPLFRLRSLDGGVVANQVPAKAVAHLVPTQGTAALVDLLRKEAAKIDSLDVTIASSSEDPENDRGDVVVTVRGKAAHSAEPELGHNAVTDLLALLGAAWDQNARAPRTACESLLLTLRAQLGRGVSSAGIGVDETHEEFGPPTANLGRLTLDEDNLLCRAKVNVRWPPPAPAKVVVARVCAKVLAESKLGDTLVCSGGGLDPFLVAPDGPLVATLSDGYRTVFGEDPTPVTIAGTTYAKAVGGAVTFGPEPAKDAGGRMHAANEFITLDELRDLVEVYTLVLTELALSPGESGGSASFRAADAP